MDDGSLAEPLVRLFGTSAGEAAMLDVLGSGSRYNQRAVVRFALDRLPSVAPAIAQAAASSADAMIRVWIVPVVAQVLPIAIAVRILERLVRDPFPRVRREALTTLARWFPGQARPHLQNGIFDSSATVREVSRFLLRESSVEFAVQYRAALTTQSNARTLANAIAGLGEVGAAPDADVTAQHLSHPTSKVRRVAAKTVMRLAPERYLQSVLGILQDPSPMVSTAARNALVRHAHAITRSALMAIFATATAPHVRKNVIALLSSLPKWDAIISLLQVVSDSDAELVSIACRHLRRWNAQYNRSQAAPSRVELEELARALARADQTLDEATVREIRFAMSAFI
jgi:HEAT repeat protein